MKRGILVPTLILLLATSLYLVSADTVDDQMQRLTYYAEEYETGNIDYVRLLIYLSNIRESINEVVGVVENDGDSVLKIDQIESILGPPTDFTKWAWVETGRGGNDIRLDEAVPEWRKIVFDGNKIQIRIEAYPNIIERIDKDKLVYRLHFNVEFKRPEDQIDVKSKIKEITLLAETFSVDPSRGNAETLAEESVNAERAFEQSFNQGGDNCQALMIDLFGNENKREKQNIVAYEIEFFDGEDFAGIINLDMCEDCSDWQWINIYSWIEGRGPGFDHRINDVDFTDNDREIGNEDLSFEEFEEKTREILDEIKNSLEENDFRSARNSMNELNFITQDWNEVANNVWEVFDQKFEIDWDSMTEEEHNDCNKNYCWIVKEQERREAEKNLKNDNYNRRKTFYLDLFSEYDQTESHSTEENWEIRLIEEFKEFGEEICDNNLDDNDNGAVDCSDEQCGGKVCGKLVDISIDEETLLYCIAGTCQVKDEIIIDEGPICGNNICEPGEMGEIPLQFENETLDEEDEEFPPECAAVDCLQGFHCITGGNCVEDEENKVTLCHIPPGNPSNAHTIEVGAPAVDAHLDHGDYLGECIDEEKSLFCPQDCVSCPVHDPVPCSGTLIFSGEDLEGCPLQPICIEEEESCQVDEDCTQPLCAETVCSKGICEIDELIECRDPDCVDGEEKIQQCESGESIVIEKCLDGLWETTKVECKDSEGESCNDFCWDEVSTMSFSCPGHLEISGSLPNCGCDWICDEVVGVECTVKNDCGNYNDVCSNGKCVTIPEIIEEEAEEIEEDEEIVPGLSPEVPEENEVEDNEAEDEQEAEQEVESELTDNIISNFFRALAYRLTITGRVVNNDFVALQDDNGNEDDPVTTPEPDPEPTPDPESTPDPDPEPTPNPEPDLGGCPNPGEPPEITNECWYEETFDDRGCVSGYDYFCDDKKEFPEDKFDDHDDNFDEDYKDDFDYEEDCKNQCQGYCFDRKIRPCTEDCIWEECGDNLECNVEDVRNSCENRCESETDILVCEDDCSNRCLSGEDIWKDFEDDFEEHKEEKGVFTVGGSCRSSQGRTEAFIWFGGWGTFDDIHRLKEKYYREGDNWCQNDFDNLKIQRREFEKGFNQEFVTWFFDKYLANSADDWQKHMSGIFDLYWNDVSMSEQIADRMQCLNIDKFPEHNLIRVEHETDYGTIEFWEELEVKRIHDNEEATEIISPFMKLWIFPSRDFFKLEMKKAMERGEMPGPPEDIGENRNTPSEEEKRKLIDEGILEDIRDFNEDFGEHVVVQFVDFETGEVAFNIYTRVNENEILYFEPMFPEDNPSEDVRIELDVEKMLDIVEFMETGHVELESPPWSQKKRIGVVEGVTDGVQMFFKFRSLMNSARVFPESAEEAGDFYMRDFFSIIMGDEGDRDRDDFDDEEFTEGREGPGGCQDEEECREYCEENRRECEQFRDNQDLREVFEPKEVITGEVIRG